MIKDVEGLLEQFKSIIIAERYLAEVIEVLEQKKEERALLIVSVDNLADKLEELERFNLKTLFRKTLVSEEEQHEVEKQDYLLTALKYRDCTEVINILEFELEILKEKVTQKESVEAKLTLAIKEDLAKSEKLLPGQIRRLVEINESIKDCVNFKREIYEARLVASKIQEVLGVMLGHLNNARTFDNWGQFYAEVQAAKVQHKVHMDKAHIISPRVGVLMLKLKSELVDIFEYKSKIKMLSYEELLNFQDGFHESMITDWVVSNDVISSMALVQTTNSYIQRIINSLDDQKAKTETKMNEFKEKRDILIEFI